MRHLQHRHKLGRKKEHREALMSNLAAALLTHGRIQTTLSKAKALRPFIEKVITLAKRAQTATPERAVYLRRLALARVRDPKAVALLFRERVSEFADRPGGYTRIYKLGTRIGDAAEMAVIQLIPASDEGYPKKGRKKAASPKKADAEEAAVEVEEAPAAEVEAVASTEENAPAEEVAEEKKEP